MQDKTRPSFQFDHIGVNCENEKAAAEIVSALSLMFGLESATGKNSIFYGPNVEILKHPGPGQNGHIGFSTPSVEQARSYLEELGFAFDMDSAKYTESGLIRVVYLKQNIGGFALHLIRQK